MEQLIGLLNNIKTALNQSFRVALWNSFSKNSWNIPTKKSVVEFRFKKDSEIGVFLEAFQLLQNRHSVEHMRISPSDLQIM